jgi:hypothetical protein
MKTLRDAFFCCLLGAGIGCCIALSGCSSLPAGSKVLSVLGDVAQAYNNDCNGGNNTGCGLNTLGARK